MIRDFQTVHDVIRRCNDGDSLDMYSWNQLKVFMRDIVNLYEQEKRCRMNAVKRLEELGECSKHD